MKKLLSFLLVTAMMLAMASTGFVSSGTSSDPADTYTPVSAPMEDSTINMWFEHSTVKVHQEDTTSNGRNTYSVYMAKNEIQGAQVILYSTEDKTNITAAISDFSAMDGSDATIPATLYYEFYVQISNVNTGDVYGLESGDESIIREGMTPDAIVPIENINARNAGKFSLAAGKSQALYYRLTTSSDTPSGWYSATFEVQNSSGDVIKTATVYAYVWDFEISEETTYQTSFLIGTTDTTTYKLYYDYLLENRLVGMNVPGTLNSSNEYISNPRVTAFRVANSGSYFGTMTNAEISAVYEDLSQLDNWETIKEKAYFYTVDEPTSQEQNDACIAAGAWTSAHATITNVNSEYTRISSVWPDPYTVVPYHENTPYPYNTYSTSLAQNSDGTYTIVDDGRTSLASIKDSTQGMFDANSVTIWCPKMCAYTPNEYIKNSGYIGTNTVTAHVRNLNGIISGFNIVDVNGCYFDWDSKFGAFEDRFNAYQAERAAAGQNIKLWWYACGVNANYTYANHLIENTGLQTEIMTWQAMQVGVTGYLYYSVDGWTENGSNNYTSGSDVNYNGTTGSNVWPTNMATKDGYNYYGNGVLFYGREVASKLRLKSTKVVGTIRVEQLRDGVEDYEMLSLYRDIYGEDAMQKLISKVSDNVACYLSLPLFDTSEYSDSMTSDDIFAAVRVELGNAIESGTTSTSCAEHTWDEGTVTKAPTYTTTGEKTYTCSVCGETKTEEISVLVKLGDVNGDKRITAKDLVALKKYVSDASTASVVIKNNSDMNSDKRINAKDIRALKVNLAT